MNWEYRIDKKLSRRGLAVAGQQGWELVNWDQRVAVLKRPLLTTSEREEQKRRESNKRQA